MSAPATAQSAAQSAWTPAKTKSAALGWEVGYLALGALDTAETISCLDRGRCHEGNPIFGGHPSSGKLIATRVGLSLIHFAAFTYINNRNSKVALRAAQISCAVQGGAVLLNARFGF